MKTPIRSTVILMTASYLHIRPVNLALASRPAPASKLLAASLNHYEVGLDLQTRFLTLPNSIDLLVCSFSPLV
jgi:hypothetical protein